VADYIPVSRIADMLLHPGESIDFNGQTVVFPNVRTVYWAGGNPFHHHQDLNRLVRAWSRPETVIVNEPFWTATARYADIVFPCTSPLERNDFGMGLHDCYLTPMRKAVEPFAHARNDYDVFSELASLLGGEEAFTEGRDEMQWVHHLYEVTRSNAVSVGIELPDFEEFWSGEQFSIEQQVPAREFMFEKFRQDLNENPLHTPSGRIELYSETIAQFGYDDCHGHPRWYDKQEWLGADRVAEYPLHLISNQPRTRLHSQYDHARTSRKDKIQKREPARMHPTEGTSRGIRDGDVVRLFNGRGACLAGIRLTASIRPGVVELATGAWYDPLDPFQESSLEVHGNPNVLTRDAGTSKLAQGPTAHSCLVQVERFDGPLPPIKVFDQPPTVIIDE
jgi:biotin/methionine sulfoxide reductase